MKIGLVDVDSHNFPNLCLMKLSEYHTRRGDRVEWWSPKGRYDLVYKSRVFTDTYSKDTIVVNNAEKVIQGGTGYGPGGKDLPYEIEHIRPDYFLYPRFLGTAYGFLSRGCPRNCGFCIVSGKEGRRSAKVADLSEFWRGEDEIKLLDPNLLACPDHEALLEQLWKMYIPQKMPCEVDCNALAKQYSGISGSDIANAVFTAAVSAARDGEKVVAQKRFGTAIQRCLAVKVANQRGQVIASKRILSEDEVKEKLEAEGYNK